MDKIRETIGLILLVAVLGGATFFGLKSIDQANQEKVAASEINTLQKQVADLQQKISGVSKDQQTLSTNQQALTADQKTLSDTEAANRQVIHQKSQDELLTAAVAKVSPSVVSIVISKEVPNLTVTYENPFGNDPNFQNFGFQVPVYTQNGTTLQKVGAGSGFFITNDGYILTNRHVAGDTSAQYTVLTSDGKQLPASVVYVDSDPSMDIAIIKVSGKFTPVSLGDSSGLQLGQSVIAIGNALGEYNNSVSVGIISGLNRTIEASDSADGSSETLNGVIQTDAAINPGNSGGPLLDLNGLVDGINVATVQGSNNISFSIPINTVKSIIKSVIGK